MKRKQQWDWRKQQWLLHLHDNHKFQSVYTPREQPVFEAGGESRHLGDRVIIVLCSAMLLVFAVLAVLKVVGTV